jgi:hypothetical protein
MRSLVFIFVLTCLSSASAKNPTKDLTNLWDSIAALPLQARLLKSTEYFVGSPVGFDPLGDGEGIDPGPTYSLEKFDCTTYVETNLAIALSKTTQEVPEILSKIRYRDGRVNYYQRNHFMVSDWIPSNSKGGYVREMTSQLSQEKTSFKTDKKNLNKTIWFYHRAIDLLDKQKKSPQEILKQLSAISVVPAQDEKASYLLASYFRPNGKAMMDLLPDVSVVMFIRNIPSSPTLVNHMGFAVKRNGKLFLNHAPQTKPFRVQEVLLEDYFKEMDAHRAPIDGLLFLAVGA